MVLTRHIEQRESVLVVYLRLSNYWYIPRVEGWD